MSASIVSTLRRQRNKLGGIEVRVFLKEGTASVRGRPLLDVVPTSEAEGASTDDVLVVECDDHGVKTYECVPVENILRVRVEAVVA